MDNILDSLCLLLGDVKITLPLNNGKMEEPILYPSKYLTQAIFNNAPQFALEYPTAGNQFI